MDSMELNKGVAAVLVAGIAFFVTGTIGDILVKFAGSPVTTTESLQSLLGANRVGTATPVTVLRGGEPRDLTVTVGERG